jgi:peptidoglycan lytic transglycosylase
MLSCSSAPHRADTEPRRAVASWYGNEFHGKATASGERFDMFAFTCAHRELPFGTILQVMNPANGRSATCVVNDRGPFVEGRDIDLSYATAREIGLESTGRVMLEYLGRDTRYVRDVRYVRADGPFTVQIGSFRDPENARRLKAGLDLNYGDVYIHERVVNESTHYRVRIGRFSDRRKAFGIAKKLAEEGYSPLIMPFDEQA